MNTYEALAREAVHQLLLDIYAKGECAREMEANIPALTILVNEGKEALLKHIITPRLVENLMSVGYGHQGIATCVNDYLASQGVKKHVLKGSVHHYIRANNIPYAPQQVQFTDESEMTRALQGRLEEALKDAPDARKPEAHPNMSFFTNDADYDKAFKAVNYVMNNPRLKVSVDQVHQILLMRAEDKTGKEISKAVGCSYAFVYQVLNKLGETKKLRVPRFSDKEEKIMVESVRTLGFAEAVRSNGHTGREYLAVLRRRAPDVVVGLYEQFLASAPQLRSAFCSKS
jgi:hypothetical protein